MSEEFGEVHEEQIAEPKHSADIQEEEHSEPEKQPKSDQEDVAEVASQPEVIKEQKFMTIDVPYVDEQGNEQTRRITVPIIKEIKERKYRIVKRKRKVPQRVSTKKSLKDAEEEVEEEYDACMMVETVTKTVLIRDVRESGDVEQREEEFKEEYFIGKERKYRFITVEKINEDGTTEEVKELKVESEDEEEKTRKKKRIRKRILKNRYNSQHELIGEEYECEWMDEEEGRVREEFSHIEEEELKEPSVEDEREEEIVLEDEEWKAIDELIQEGEEESLGEVEEEEEKKEEIPKETSWERERKKQKISFYKLLKLFLNEIERRKVLIRDLKLFFRLTGTKVQSPGKEFDKNPQKFIDNEAAELEALTKHLIKVYDQYKEEEEMHKKEIDEVRASTNEQLETYRNLLYQLIHDSDPTIMQRLTKGKDLKKKVDETFEYEELLSKEYVKKAICTLNIEQIKYLLFTEVDQSDVPDEEKEVDPFELDKMIKALKHFESESLEDHSKLEGEMKKFVRILEDVTCKRREADYLVRKEEEFLQKKPLIEKGLDEREEIYWKLKKYWREWQNLHQTFLKDNTKERFPAIYHNQKKLDVQGLSREMLKNLKLHCPMVLKRKNDRSQGCTGSKKP